MTTNKYLLFFRSKDWYADLSPEQAKQVMTKWSAWYEGLVREGTVDHGSPLAPEGKVVAGKDAVVSDGPFAEAKETVGGYFLVNAATIDEAVEVAKGCPGLPFGIRVEVRQMLELCPFAEKLGVTIGPKLAAV